MATNIIRPKDREDWLEVRKGGIGSSEIATVIGLNQWETPYQLWRRKVGIDPPKEQNFAMKAGHYLEDAVSRFWSDATGREIIKRSAGDWIIQDAERRYLQVSPDRTYWLDEGRGNDNKGILECKTTQLPIDPDNLPKYWFVQVQYQLGVAGLEQGSLAWLQCGRDFGYRDIKFNPKLFGFLVESAERFWVDCVKNKQEPEPINIQDVMLKYNQHVVGKVSEVDGEIYDAYTALKDVKAEIKKLEERQEQLEERIKLTFEDAEAISFGGEILATWKTSKPSMRFDAKALQKDEPETYARYLKEQGGSRRFLLK